MAKRGRKSAAELSLISQRSAVIAQRIAPPASMPQAESEVWLEVVNDQPAEAFTETHTHLLELYCGHVVKHRIIHSQVLAFKPEWLKDTDGLDRYDKLLKMAERESRSASALATRLRITRQAIDKKIAGRQQRDGNVKQPWDE